MPMVGFANLTGNAGYILSKTGGCRPWNHPVYQHLSNAATIYGRHSYMLPFCPI